MKENQNEEEVLLVADKDDDGRVYRHAGVSRRQQDLLDLYKINPNDYPILVQEQKSPTATKEQLFTGSSPGESEAGEQVRNRTVSATVGL